MIAKVFFVFRKFGGLTKGSSRARFPPGVGCLAEHRCEGKQHRTRKHRRRHRQQRKRRAKHPHMQKCINRVYPYDRLNYIIIMCHMGYKTYLIYRK